MSTSDHYEVIVVGGGHNGLICGAYLAKAGLKTLLLEAREEVGGCASTVDAIGARVNICNCDHILFRSTNIAQELELEKHGLKYLDINPLNLAVFWSEEFDPWFLYRNPEETTEGFAKHYPNEVEGYNKYLKIATPIVKLIVAATSQTPTFNNTLKALLTGGTKHGSSRHSEASHNGTSHSDKRRRGEGRRLAALANLQKWQKMSAVGVLREFFSHEALILPALGLGPAVWGVDMEAKGTGLGALSYALRHHIGIARPQGGSGALTEALKKSFLSHGGEIQCGAKVEHISIYKDAVQYVGLESGEKLPCEKVVAACDPADIITNRLSDSSQAFGTHKSVSDKFISRWKNQPLLDGYESKVDALTTKLPTYKKLPDVSHSSSPASTSDIATIPTAVIMPKLSDVAEGFRDCTEGSAPKLPIMLANFPSAKDPTMLKPELRSSHHIMSLEVLHTPYALRGGWKDSNEPQRWLELYDTLLEEPNFQSNIINWRAMTPTDYETDFNLVRGYAPSYAGSPISAVFSKQKELTRYKSPIRGLFFSGAGTFPGAGIWGASGRNVARVILKHQSKRH